MKKPKPSLQMNAPFTLILVLLSFLIHLINRYTDGAAVRVVFSVYHSSLRDPLTYVRFVFHVLGNADWKTLYVSMIPILVLGPNLEERYGTVQIFAGSMATVVLSGIIHFAAFPNGEVMMGAEGVMYMMYLLATVGGSKAGGIPLTMLLVLVAYSMMEIQSVGAGAILRIDHIVGALCGVLMGMSLRAAPPPPEKKDDGGKAEEKKS